MGIGSFQRVGKQFPTEQSKCFPPERGLLFSTKMGATLWHYILALGTQQPFLQASHSRLTLCDSIPCCSPFTHAEVSSWECKTCEQVSQNKRKAGKKKRWLFLQWALSVSSREKIHGLSPLGAAWAGDPSSDALCLGAQSEAPGFTPLQGSTHNPVATTPTTLESSIGSFRVPTLSTHLEVVFGHS